jgi:hypothetical protein
MDALETGTAEKNAGAVEVGELVRLLAQAPWEESPAVGEGREFRVDAKPETHASALTFENCVLHGSAVMGAAV